MRESQSRPSMAPGAGLARQGRVWESRSACFGHAMAGPHSGRAGPRGAAAGPAALAPVPSARRWEGRPNGQGPSRRRGLLCPRKQAALGLREHERGCGCRHRCHSHGSGRDRWHGALHPLLHADAGPCTGKLRRALSDGASGQFLLVPTSTCSEPFSSAQRGRTQRRRRHARAVRAQTLGSLASNLHVCIRLTLLSSPVWRKP